MVMTHEPEQLSFVPASQPEIDDELIDLTYLPDDAALYGPPPGKALVESIRLYGVLDPVLVMPIGHNRNYRVLDGRRRIKAARLAGLTEIPARVLRIEDELRAWMPSAVSLLAHATRTANPSADIEAIETLAAQGASESEIQAATGMAIPTIRKRLRLMGLLPELLEAIKRGQIAPSVGEEAVKLARDGQLELWRVFGEAGKLTAADVARLRRVEVETASTQTLALAGLDAIPSADAVLEAAAGGPVDSGSYEQPPDSVRLGFMVVDRELLAQVLTDLQSALNKRDVEPLRRSELALLELLEG